MDRISKFREFLNEEPITDIIKNQEKSVAQSIAAKQAKQLKLHYVGFARYANNKGKITHIVKDGRLVPFKSSEKVAGETFDLDTKENKTDKDKFKKHELSGYKKFHSSIKKDMKDFGVKQKQYASDTAKALKQFIDPKELKPEEKEALKQYSGFMFEPINQFLYKGLDEKQSKNGEYEYMQELVGHLDNIVHNNFAPFNYHAYSGLSKRYKPENLKPGQEYIFRGFLSTTPDISMAQEFTEIANRDSYKSVALEIHIKKGQKSYPIFDFGLDPKEQEVLLPRGTKIRILETPRPVYISTDEDDEKALFHIVKCEIVEDDMEDAY